MILVQTPSRWIRRDLGVPAYRSATRKLRSFR